MTRLESADKIEALVGWTRHPIKHIGRAVSSEQRVYILHSEACRDSGIDLRDCAFSEALDGGIHYADWDGREDRPVVLEVDPSGWLVPWPVGTVRAGGPSYKPDYARTLQAEMDRALEGDNHE